MTSASKKNSVFNQVVTFLTIILGIIGLWNIYETISFKFATHTSSTAGLAIIVFIFIGFIGFIISVILLGVSMSQELKNRKLTIITTLIFLISIVLSFSIY